MTARNQIGFILLAMLAGIASATNAFALDTFMLGPRAMGMGGANVASVDNTSAQYYNPAAFGFFGCTDIDGKRIYCDNNNLARKDWGIDVSGSAGIRLHNNFGEFFDSLDRTLLGNVSDGITSQADLEGLINLVEGLVGLSQPGNAFTADSAGGVGIRYKNFGIGAWGFGQWTGRELFLDTANLGLDTDFSTELNNPVLAPAGWANDGSPSYFSAADYATLVTALGADAADKVDFIAAQQGLDPVLASDVASVIQAMDAQAGTGTLANNGTTVLLSGFGHLEVPVTYGAPINDNLAIGGSVKLMRGRVYATQLVVFDNDVTDAIETTGENFEQSDAVGFDVGVLARFPNFNLGVVARNVNSPEFEGGTIGGVQIEDVTLDPQATAGIAFIPHETFTFEVDYDLTSNETTLENYETQNIRFGLEWDAWRAVALRAGAYKNLAETDIDWVFTAGLGINLWAARLDIAGAASGEKDEFDEKEYPTEARVAAQLSIDF